MADAYIPRFKQRFEGEIVKAMTDKFGYGHTILIFMGIFAIFLAIKLAMSMGCHSSRLAGFH